jgi:hypothetical protein
VAGLNRRFPFSIAISVALAVATLAAPLAATADGPIATSVPAPARATCADRFPAEGPAGVDLRLGCIAGEIVGLYTASSGQPPAPISTWLLVLIGGLAIALVAGWIVTRALARRAGRRLAPVLSGSWWVCDRCRSVNGAEKARCYSCGAPPPSGGPTMPTTERPEIPQSFGGGGSR